MSHISILGITSLPEIKPDHNLVELLVESEPKLTPGDILTVTHKAVSTAEGRLFKLSEVAPSVRAQKIAERWEKDPGLVELVLRESRELLREENGVLISLTRQGFVCANAGIDLSNVDGGETACLLPIDCDASARDISTKVSQKLGFHIPVIVTDSFGRPWRLGITNVALGCFGLEPLLDHRGSFDCHGLEMKATVIAVADTLAASTELVVGKTSQCGAAIIRGYSYQKSLNTSIQETLRPWPQCFFT